MKASHFTVPLSWFGNWSTEK